ncbi:AlbA family DNA-binding domain-containing protein [Burkholderia cenocepacia]|uniref:AlbA family DNA-binding domain-containing protein n=1 Tax=Burkholderia cenocepacia TaxID=95486 RepID=UPI00285CF66D|nr:ATP-binding protein [Burkholderia cenocepacia]MDR5643605.1 ATP-binding protein [Burkholderia cenocepacia]
MPLIQWTAARVRDATYPSRLLEIALSQKEIMVAEIDNSRVKALVERPSESLAVEIKTWIDPDSVDGKAKLVRAMLALRNANGGYLLIGFDDKTLAPDLDRLPADVKSTFHPDKIYALVARFASELFDVTVEFVERDALSFPVIVIPAGVRTPVVAKSDLMMPDGSKAVAEGDIYVRTLNANRRPSSAKVHWKDWPGLIDTCFDNREADIGRFVRRHLSGLSPDGVKLILGAMSKNSLEAPAQQDRLQKLLGDGMRRFLATVAERSLSLPKTGSWEVAMYLDGPVPNQRIGTFLNLLKSSNPEYTGWPVWLVSDDFGSEADRPRVIDDAWEALIALPSGRHTDFERLDPKGNFYNLRTLFDDLQSTDYSPTPGVAFDYALPIYDCSEAIAVGLAFGKAMGCQEDDCALEFAFRWSGLRGRELVSWYDRRGGIISPGRKAHQDAITLYQSVPLSTPLSAIGGLLAKSLQPLYALFAGFELSSKVIEDKSTLLVERKANF